MRVEVWRFFLNHRRLHQLPTSDRIWRRYTWTTTRINWRFVIVIQLVDHVNIRRYHSQLRWRHLHFWCWHGRCRHHLWHRRRWHLLRETRKRHRYTISIVNRHPSTRYWHERLKELRHRHWRRRHRWWNGWHWYWHRRWHRNWRLLNRRARHRLRRYGWRLWHFKFRHWNRFLRSGWLFHCRRH